MNPVSPSIKPARFDHWKQTAARLSWGLRGGREKILDLWMDYSDAHPDHFRKRYRTSGPDYRVRARHASCLRVHEQSGRLQPMSPTSLMAANRSSARCRPAASPA